VPRQVPSVVQRSSLVQFVPSEQLRPTFLAGYWQPRAGSQVPTGAEQTGNGGVVQVTGRPPPQTFILHVSPTVQRSPSMQSLASQSVSAQSTSPSWSSSFPFPQSVSTRVGTATLTVASEVSSVEPTRHLAMTTSTPTVEQVRSSAAEQVYATDADPNASSSTSRGVCSEPDVEVKVTLPVPVVPSLKVARAEKVAWDPFVSTTARLGVITRSLGSGPQDMSTATVAKEIVWVCCLVTRTSSSAQGTKWLIKRVGVL